MERISEFIMTKIEPTLSKFNNSIIVRSMMSAFMLIMPLTIAGAFATLAGSLQIAGWQSFLSTSGLGYYLTLPIKFTTQFMATLMSITVAYSYLKLKGNESPLTGALLSLVSFLILTPLQTTTTDLGTTYAISMEQLTFTGTLGIFTALLVGFCVGALYQFFVEKKITIKMPDSVPTFISSAFTSLIPGLIVTALSMFLAYGFSLTPFGSIHTVIYGLVQQPLTNLGGTLGAVVLIAIISQVLWFFGIHGSMAVFSIIMPIWMPIDAANLLQFQADGTVPNIISLSFFTTYTPGGFGISTAILLLLAKSKRYKSIGRLSIVPAAFNITEPIIFGVPLVMNPIFFIPYVFSNVIALVIAYAVTVIGLVPAPAGVSIPTGTPVILNAIMQGSWKIAVLQFVLIVIIMLFWYPFIRYADRKECELEISEG